MFCYLQKLVGGIKLDFPEKRRPANEVGDAIMSNEVRDYAHKAGFYVIEQTGDTVRINIPEGFKAREW